MEPLNLASWSIVFALIGAWLSPSDLSITALLFANCTGLFTYWLRVPRPDKHGG